MKAIIEQLIASLEKSTSEDLPRDMERRAAIKAGREALKQSPVALMNPNEGSCSSAFIWANNGRDHPEYSVPVYVDVPKAPGAR